MSTSVAVVTQGPIRAARAAILAGLLSVACDDAAEKPSASAPRARSQAVVAEASVAPAQGSPAAENAAEKGTASAEAAAPRVLCQPRTGKERKTVPLEATVARAAAPGEQPLAEGLPVAVGKVSWVNFWAAWCAPCKEEIPRLLAWEKRLVAQGTPFQVLFVSLDDDERQLREFLAREQPDGLRRTYWLREGSQREQWLAQVGMDTDPRLPAHLVVNGRGNTHCVVDGAVEDSDFPEVERLVTAARE